jgi:hypothetical protein
MWSTLLLLIAALTRPAYAVDPCSAGAVQGPYGLYLSGVSTISGSPTPFATLSRIVFDGARGLSGYSSVNFNGLLLGNPVTGTYEVKPDCTMSWSLQDDSGAFQHFTGKLTAVGSKVEVQQTDAGTGGHGTLQRTSNTCTTGDLRPGYNFTLSGTATPLASGDVPGTISAKGEMRVNGATTFAMTQTLQGRKITADGTFAVESDCITRFEFALPVKDGKATVPMKLRGILVNEGKEILAIQTDPGTVVSARFTAR